MRFYFLTPFFPLFSTGVLQVPARVAAVLHGGQLHVDVLRGVAPAHGPGGGVRQRRVRDALVLRHRLGLAGRADGRVRFVEELLGGHGAVSVPPARTYEPTRSLTVFVAGALVSKTVGFPVKVVHNRKNVDTRTYTIYFMHTCTVR